MQQYPSLSRRLWNMRPWRSSPLMRASYRAESMLCVVACAVIAMSLPIAAAIGTATYTAQVAEHERAAASVQVVDAVAQSDSGPVAVGVTTVRARWVVGGNEHIEPVVIDSACKSGDRIPVHVDGDGNRVSPPPNRARAVPDAVALAVGLFGLSAATILLIAQIVHYALNHRRRERWTRDWAALADVRKWHYL